MPSSGFLAAILAQSSPEMGFFTGAGAGVCMSPRVALSVMQAFVMMQRSPSFNSTVEITYSGSPSPAAVLRLFRYRVLAVMPAPSAKSISVTSVFSLNTTPWLRR